MTPFLLCAAAAALGLFLYPYLIYPLILARLPARAVYPGDPAGRTGAGVSLLFCAWNEERALPAKIGNLIAIKARLPEIEIIVYSDASDDATDELLRAHPLTLRTVRGLARRGKIEGLRWLVEEASGDTIVLTDANTLISPDTLPNLLAYFDDPAVGAATGVLSYLDTDVRRHGATASVGGAYWRLEERIKRLESASGSMMAGDGALLAMRRHLYPSIEPDLSDDMAASLAVMFDGYRCVSAPDVHACERGCADSAEEFSRKRRIACGSYTTHRRHRADIRRLGPLDRFKWCSHRVLRWWGGALLALSLGCALAAAATLGLAVPAVAGCLGAALALEGAARLGHARAGQVREIVLALLATSIGMIDSVRGRAYRTWRPASSR